jgi:PAS domain S-box-containing protein
MDEQTVTYNLPTQADLPAFFVAVDTTGTLVLGDLNPACEQTTGLRARDVSGRPPEEVSGLSSTATAALRANCLRCLEAEAPVSYDEQATWPVGVRTFRTTLVPAGEAGGVRHILALLRDTGEEKRLKKELLESRDLQRAIVDAAPVAVIGLDLDGLVQRVWNPAAEQLLGWSAEEAMGRPLPSVPTESSEEFRRLRERIRKGLTLDGVEVRRQRRDGSPIDYSIHASPLHDADGGIIGNIAVIVDISEQKRVDAALRVSEARYVDLYENAPDMFLSVNARTGLVERCNQTLADALGRPKEEIIGSAGLEIYHPESRDRSREVLREFLATGELHDVELQLQKKDGSPLDVSLSATAVRDSDGTILLSRSTLRDITVRKQMERALALREKEYRTLIENVPDFVVRYDLDMKRTYVNPAWERASGLSAAEVVGVAHTDLPRVPQPLVEHYSAKLRQVLATGVPQRTEFPWINARGDELRLEYSIVPEYGAGGRVSGALAIGRDVTERRRTERQLALTSFALNSVHEAAFLIDDDARIHYVNDEACRLLGYSEGELLAMSIPDINPGFPPDSWSDHWNELKSRLSLTFEGELTAKAGHLVPVEINANYFEYKGRAYDLGLVRDTTERKAAEKERLANLAFFETMDRIHRAIQASEGLQDMMRRLLDVVMSVFDCDRTFLMVPCDPNAKSWFAPMERSKPNYPGVLALNHELPMDPEVAETLRILLATDGPVAFGPGTSRPVPEEIAERFCIKSFLSMALHPATGSPWQFGIHQCEYDRIWTAEEIRTFKAIGRRVADGLSSLLSYRDLRESEEFLERVIDHLPSMVYVRDAESLQFVRLNKPVEEFVGLPREQMLGGTARDLFPAREADFFAAHDRQAIDSGKPVDLFEDSVRNSKREERILHATKLPILDETGQPRYLLGIAEDVTERRKAEASVRQLSQAIEQSPVSIVITDTTGKIEFVNEYFTQTTGYSLTEALGEKPSILKSGEASEAEYRELWRTITSGHVWRGKFHNRRKDGSLYWESATISPVKNEEDVITHYVAVKEDITEVLELEAQLRQAQKMEAIGQLAGGVAHDFNNMLGVIIGHTDVALMDAQEGQEDYMHLMHVREAASRSADLTRQLLAFASEQTVLPQVLDLNETIAGMLKILSRLIGEAIELSWKPADEVWPVLVDPAQIDQILANLCVNARDAVAGAGQVTIETQNVTLGAAFAASHPGFVPGDYVKLAVTDNGCGMDSETLDRIFEPFFTTKERGRGTGLGLATVYGIVKQSSGHIDVSSQPGVGTTFRIYLSRHIGMPEPRAEVASSSSDLRGNETILVVEDEKSLLRIVGTMLESYGYRVLLAPTPAEALQLARRHAGEIHLLLTDVVMPKMRGQELAIEVARLCPEAACMYMTGYSGGSIADYGGVHPEINLLRKPFTEHGLLTKVREVLDHRARSDEI